MRPVVLLVVAITVVLPVSLTVVLLMPQSWKTAITASLTAGFRSGTAQRAPAAAPKTAAASPHRKSVRGKMNSASETPDPAVPPAMVTVDIMPEYKPFPVRGDVDRGATRARVLAAFGPPLAKATGSDDGRLVEQYYYADSSTHRRTMLRLIDGRVAGVSTWTEEP